MSIIPSHLGGKSPSIPFECHTLFWKALKKVLLYQVDYFVIKIVFQAKMNRYSHQIVVNDSFSYNINPN